MHLRQHLQLAVFRAVENKRYLLRSTTTGATAVVAPTGGLVAVYNEEGNWQTNRAVERHPDRLLGLAVANPWYGAKAVDILRAAFDRHLAGLFRKEVASLSSWQDGINIFLPRCFPAGKARLSFQ